MTLRFDLGKPVATPGALAALRQSRQTALEFLARHAHGEWGELDASDKAANERALTTGSRILSKYVLNNGEAIFIITEATDDHGERSSTCILLPSEY